MIFPTLLRGSTNEQVSHGSFCACFYRGKKDLFLLLLFLFLFLPRISSFAALPFARRLATPTRAHFYLETLVPLGGSSIPSWADARWTRGMRLLRHL